MNIQNSFLQPTQPTNQGIVGMPPYLWGIFSRDFPAESETMEMGRPILTMAPMYPLPFFKSLPVKKRNCFFLSVLSIVRFQAASSMLSSCYKLECL